MCTGYTRRTAQLKTIYTVCKSLLIYAFTLNEKIIIQLMFTSFTRN